MKLMYINLHLNITVIEGKFCHIHFQVRTLRLRLAQGLGECHTTRKGLKPWCKSDPKSFFHHCTGGRFTMKSMKLSTSSSYTYVNSFHGRCSSDVFPWSYAFGKFAELNDFNCNQLWLLSVSILTRPQVTPSFMSGGVRLAFWWIWLKRNFRLLYTWFRFRWLFLYFKVVFT